MADRSVAAACQPGPHRRARTERRIVGLRVTRRLGPARIAFRLGLHALDRACGPGPLWLPAAGPPGPRPPASRSAATSASGPASWSTSTSRNSATSPTAAAGASPGARRASTTGPPPPAPRRNRYGQPLLGYGYLHTALDDHSRLAYTEILADERKDTAAAFLARAHAWYAAAGITIERVISDNGACYRSRDLGAMPAPSSASPTSAPAPTGPRPTAKSSASTAPWPTNGPTPAPTPPKPNAAPPLTPGCTPTTITGDTPHSAASHPPAASPTSPGRTPRPPRR